MILGPPKTLLNRLFSASTVAREPCLATEAYAWVAGLREMRRLSPCWKTLRWPYVESFTGRSASILLALPALTEAKIALYSTTCAAGFGKAKLLAA